MPTAFGAWTGDRVRPEHIHTELRALAGFHPSSKRFPLGIPEYERLRHLGLRARSAREKGPGVGDEVDQQPPHSRNHGGAGRGEPSNLECCNKRSSQPWHGAPDSTTNQPDSTIRGCVFPSKVATRQS